jgi:hypothetical protein
MSRQPSQSGPGPEIGGHLRQIKTRMTYSTRDFRVGLIVPFDMPRVGIEACNLRMAAGLDQAHH